MSKKYSILIVVVKIIILISPPKAQAFNFENTTDHCVAWEAKKTYLGLYSIKPTGKSCKQEVQIRQEGSLYFVEMKVSVSSFDSKEKKRDEYILNTLTNKDYKNLIFQSEKQSKEKWLSLAYKGKFHLSGFLFIKNKKVPIKASVKRYHIGLKSFISGSVETSLKHLNIDPPSLFLGTVNVKQDIKLFYQFDLSKIINMSSLIEKEKSIQTKEDFYKIRVVDLSNKIVDLKKYKNKYLLIVNIASKCGYVNQLNDLQKLYENYKSKNFEIIAIPSNQFQQEPLQGEKLKQFCRINYGVSYKILKRSMINGENRHPIYKYLLNFLPANKKGDIRWNYEKILVEPGGKPIERFSSSTSVNKIESFISKYLDK